MSHLSKKLARVDAGTCVACGCCLKVCPRQALSVFKGSYAVVNQDACVGCGLCAKECPASVISILPRSHQEIESAQTGGNRHE